MNKKTGFFFMLTMFFLTFLEVGSINSFAYPVRDTVGLEVLSDGTHEGEGSETFISTKHGFKVGDDNSHDGVVSSGDYVTYKLSINCVAGRERTIKVKLKLKGDYLDLDSLKRLAVSDPLVSSSYDEANKTLSIHVPRGVTSLLNATFSVKAKDTNGQVKGGNVLSAVLTSDDDYEFKADSKEITVTKSL